MSKSYTTKYSYMKYLSICLSVLVISNCSTLSLPPSLTYGDLETQIEILFRRQNQASYQVMMSLMEEESSPKLDTLEKSEQLMLEACKPLNQYAVLERDNQKISLAQKQKALDTIHPCATETEKLEILLKEYFSAP